MYVKASVFAVCLTLAAASAAPADEAEMAEATSSKENPVVSIKTSKGTIKVEVFADKAPKSAANFLQYVDESFYNGTIFHRVIDGFMVQGGGFTESMQKKPTNAPIPNEADNGLKNERGTLAMARTPDPNSATAQFFINVVDNAFLDFKSKTAQGYGYCVFGRVTEGMDVVDAIKTTPTATKGGMQNVPTETIEIIEATRDDAPSS